MIRRLVMSIAIALAINASAQVAVIEETATRIDCDSRTHALQHFREVRTILNERGNWLANFVCSCSKYDKLSSFKGTVTDGDGNVIKKMKQGELQRTEYSQYLAIDNYKMYIEYTPSKYPITVTYEWTMESRDNLIEFPFFCPQTDYDVSVKKATYTLKAPKDMKVRHALLNIDGRVDIDESDNYYRTYNITMENLPQIEREPYCRPLRERLPMAFFAPTEFAYYGTQGSLNDWRDYGEWEYSLIRGRDELPDNIRQELHSMTDNLKSDREKVEAVYKRLESTTRYVAILLGIGGQQPATASSVAKSGFGDCKGLTNYMRAMLKEIGIPSNYTTISTTNRRFLKDFASIGQMNHVILQVPLPGDTLWLECTNPRLPMGYVHCDIAGHDAIVVSENGGRLVRLPVYADTANLMRSDINIALGKDGSADITMKQLAKNVQYESRMALTDMSEKERYEVIQKSMYVPQMEKCETRIAENGASITIDADIRSRQYGSTTGQRVFVPVCPLHRGYAAQRTARERRENIWIETGYLDEDNITISIPEGFEIEAVPGNIQMDKPFGSFCYEFEVSDSNTVNIHNRLLIKAGTYDKSMYQDLADFIKSVGNIYRQKMVLKRND